MNVTKGEELARGLAARIPSRRGDIMAHQLPPSRIPRVASVVMLSASLGLGCTGGVSDGPTNPPGVGQPSGMGGSSGSRPPGPGGAGPGLPPNPPPGPGPGNAPPGTAALVTCSPQGDAPPPRRIWRLSAQQYRHTVAAALGGRASASRPLISSAGFTAPFDGTNQADRFGNQSISYSMNDSDFSQALSSAVEAAGRFVADLKKAPGGCLSMTGSALGDCLKPGIADKGAILFRRPLAPDEVAQYAGIASSKQPQLGAEEATALAFQAMLMSPKFLYRVELGEGTPDASGAVPLTSHEVAAALSYALTDGPPDEELWKAAETRSLTTPAQVRAQVERLAGALGDREPVMRFFREYFRYDQASGVTKDAKTHGFHKPDLLENDAELWMKDLATTHGRGGLLKAILTSDSAFVRAATAPNYNVPAPMGTTPQKVTFPAGQRSGLLTHPAFLTTYSDSEHTQPVQRGRFIAERLLCQDVPELPIDMIPDLPPAATMRERLKVHSSNPSCAACHHLMDPLGLGLEGYDDVGRLAKGKDGKPLDSSGELYGTLNGDGPFSDAIELSKRLAASPVVWQCFTRHSFRYWMGRQDTPTDACTVVAAQAAFDKSNGDYMELLTSLFSSRVFLHRRAN